MDTFISMKFPLILPLLFSGWMLASQNLVPNPGFDILSNCPYDEAQIDFAPPWTRASHGTPDIYNECAIDEFFNVPHAAKSYQLQRSGNGYAGIYVYTDSDLKGLEYIETPLTEALISDKKYYLEFYVSPNFDLFQEEVYTDAVGLALSDTFYFKKAEGLLPLTPVIENRGTLITDTIGWTKISGCYTAKGGEKFAIIGNFRTATETMLEVVIPSFPNLNYFFIEDVLIMPFDPLPDTLLLCDGMPEVLNAGFLEATYLWSSGEKDSTVTISEPGIYTVEAFIDDCTLRDTVVVLDTRYNDGFPSDTVICRDEPLRLAPPLPGSYLWSDGSQGSGITVATSGSYAVTVTNECGAFVFTTDVEAMDCACDVYVPNAISPNGDGINDGLQVFWGCDFDFQIKRFGVFDRWGGQVYSSTEGEEVRWDGTARGKPLPEGVYVWLMEYDVIRNGTAERRIGKGDVMILR
jgi:gliding motility-associated-like protein